MATPGETAAQQARRVRERQIPDQWSAAHQGRPSQGLENHRGVTCYRNGAIQVLIHTPKFINWLEADHPPTACTYPDPLKCICCQLHKLAMRYWRDPDDTRVVPALGEFWQACRNTSSGSVQPWRRSTQQDTQEYLEWLLSGMKLRLSGGQANVIDAIFSTGMKNTQTCRTCKAETVQRTLDSSFLLHLSGPNTGNHLSDHIRNHFAESLLEGYTCGTCQTKDQTFTKVTIEEPGHIIMMTLVRFKFVQLGSGNYTASKITDQINPLPQIDLTSYLSDAQLVPVQYKLIGAIHHRHTPSKQKGPNGETITSIDRGHYKASVVSPDGDWRTLEDRTVTPGLAFTSVCNPGKNWTPYILFYQRAYTVGNVPNGDSTNDGDGDGDDKGDGKGDDTGDGKGDKGADNCDGKGAGKGDDKSVSKSVSKSTGKVAGKDAGNDDKSFSKSTGKGDNKGDGKSDGKAKDKGNAGADTQPAVTVTATPLPPPPAAPAPAPLPAQPVLIVSPTTSLSLPPSSSSLSLPPSSSSLSPPPSSSSLSPPPSSSSPSPPVSQPAQAPAAVPAKTAPATQPTVLRRSTRTKFEVKRYSSTQYDSRGKRKASPAGDGAGDGTQQKKLKKDGAGDGAGDGAQQKKQKKDGAGDSAQQKKQKKDGVGDGTQQKKQKKKK